MTSYLEEIYERAEKLFTSDSEKLAWLSSFERPSRGKTEYTQQTIDVRDDLASSLDIKDELPKVTKLRRLSTLQTEANKIGTGTIRDETLGLINEQISILEGEAEEQAREFREAETIKEREEAQERLRELSPQSLGGIRSGEKRRAGLAFRSVFN